MKELVKRAARIVAGILVLPALVSYRLKSLLIGPDRALEGSSQMLSLIPGITGQYIRRAFLMQVLDHCHPTVVVEFGTLFSQSRARLDENVYIGPRCQIGLVHIERDTLLGPAVHVPSGAHTHDTADPTRPIREQRHVRTLVRIGAGCWIGSAAIVMAEVGADSVIGAGAVVTKPIPPRSIAVGVPAKVVRER